jgi:hypothetical protein
MLDNIEQYKTQQLERLRDNYTQQVEEPSQYRNPPNKKISYTVFTSMCDLCMLYTFLTDHRISKL